MLLPGGDRTRRCADEAAGLLQALRRAANYRPQLILAGHQEELRRAPRTWTLLLRYPGGCTLHAGQLQQAGVRGQQVRGLSDDPEEDDAADGRAAHPVGF